MEACLAVEREQEKVVKKLKTVSGSATEKLQQVLDQIQALKDQLTAGGCVIIAPSLEVSPVCRLQRWRGDAGAAGGGAAVYAKRQRGGAGCVKRSQRHARHYLQTRQGH